MWNMNSSGKKGDVRDEISALSFDDAADPIERSEATAYRDLIVERMLDQEGSNVTITASGDRDHVSIEILRSAANETAEAFAARTKRTR
jgi:hypothetical protein